MISSRSYVQAVDSHVIENALCFKQLGHASPFFVSATSSLLCGQKSAVAVGRFYEPTQLEKGLLNGWLDRVATMVIDSSDRTVRLRRQCRHRIACRIPQPFVTDVFSCVLAAATFANGRLTNLTHPMWMHLESGHTIQQPTYMSLAAGQVITGYPIAPKWALLGGL